MYMENTQKMYFISMNTYFPYTKRRIFHIHVFSIKMYCPCTRIVHIHIVLFRISNMENTCIWKIRLLFIWKIHLLFIWKMHLVSTYTYFLCTYGSLSYLQGPFQICTGLQKRPTILIYVAYLTKVIVLAASEARALLAVVQMCIGLSHKYV